MFLFCPGCVGGLASPSPCMISRPTRAPSWKSDGILFVCLVVRGLRCTPGSRCSIIVPRHIRRFSSLRSRSPLFSGTLGWPGLCQCRLIPGWPCASAGVVLSPAPCVIPPPAVHVCGRSVASSSVSCSSASPSMLLIAPTSVGVGFGWFLDVLPVAAGAGFPP